MKSRDLDPLDLPVLKNQHTDTPIPILTTNHPWLIIESLIGSCTDICRTLMAWSLLLLGSWKKYIG